MTYVDTLSYKAHPDVGRLFRDEPVFSGAALALAVFAIPTMMAHGLDTRSYLGEPVWIKPLKFQVALSIYLMTLAYFARWLPSGMTSRPAYRLFAWVVVGAVMAETAWISVAAANATGSHFNVSTPALATLYGIIGLLATVLTAASTVYGLAIWHNRATGLDPALQTGISLGLVLTLPLTLLVALYMSQHGGHHVGEGATGAKLPILGWSREVGDLRVSHFFATHAMHIVPLAMLILPRKRETAWLVSAAVIALVVATFFQARAGEPFLPL